MNIDTVVKDKLIVFLKKWWLFVLFFGVLFTNLLAVNASAFFETCYSSTIYPVITQILTHLTNWMPFSLTEVLVIALMAFGLIGIVLAILRKWQFKKFIALLIQLLALIYVCFYLFWGFNYYRLPITKRMDLPAVAIDSTMFRMTLSQVLDEANAAYVPIRNLDKDQIDHAIERGFKRVAQQLNLDLPGGLRNPKTLLFNIFLDKTLTSGFFSPITHELHINKSLLFVEYPFTLAHEKSHQMGIANEAEANFLAYLVCLASGDPAAQYSARMEVLGEFLGRGRRILSDYADFRARIAPGIVADFRAINQRWRRHQGAVSKVSSQAYDRYLKANRISEGIENYRGVVEMVIRWKTGADGGMEIKNPASEK